MRKAYTLVEVLIVVAIIAIIAVMVSPFFLRQDSGKIEGCSNPKFEQVVIPVEGFKTYVYSCAEGHIIELYSPIERK